MPMDLYVGMWISLVFSVLYLSTAQGKECNSGDLVNGSCVCFKGWMGDSCQDCSGRVRLHNSSGTIVDHVGSAKKSSDNLKCLFFIETERPTASITIKFNSFETECLWDYLHVFDGDSVFSTKLGAFTGNATQGGYDPSPPEPYALPMGTSNNGSVSNSSDAPTESESYRQPLDLQVSSSNPHMLLYFVTDGGQTGAGFNISYWVDFECPLNCSGHGSCGSNGTSCVCWPGWKGDLCSEPSCPNNCSMNGHCNETLSQCVCDDGFLGLDCSVQASEPHWNLVDYTTQGNLSLARASHSAILWEDHMVVFGGYRFPEDRGWAGLKEGAMDEDDQLLMYNLRTQSWHSVRSNGSDQPSPRYGHSAVVYNSTMYVYGGSKFPGEEITDELWALDLTNLTWTSFSSQEENNTNSSANSTSNNSTDNNNAAGTIGLRRGISTVSSPVGGGWAGHSNATPYLPFAVRGHTAHVVGSKMVVLLGFSDDDEPVTFVQEFDFVLSTWSAPLEKGVKPVSLTGHSSSYLQETGLIYVLGGRKFTLSSALYVYNPLTYSWSQLADSPQRVYLHSTIVYGPLLLAFAGSSSEDCFGEQMLVYNTACNTWDTVVYPSLPESGRRYGHSAVLDESDGSMVVFGGYSGYYLHRDVLRLSTGNCSVFETNTSCVNGSVLCAWSSTLGRCVATDTSHTSTDLTFGCSRDLCLEHDSCSDCEADADCSWNTKSNACSERMVNLTVNCTEAPQAYREGCSRYTTCTHCQAHWCVWNGNDCVSFEEYNETAQVGSDYVPASCPESVSCSAHESCQACTTVSCLWCPSLNRCTLSSLYPVSYPFGQCLGWVSTQNQCAETNCSTHDTCASCESERQGVCGWCRDPSDTGLGTCMEGGFLKSRNSSGQTCADHHWSFDQCPLCQCNGHSSCFNGTSVCIDCQNNTTGDNCEMCADTFYGNPSNGKLCETCFCNGYNPTCNPSSGECFCLDQGVTGNTCQSCSTPNYVGDADNFCYAQVNVGFIYTFQASAGVNQTFYVIRPSSGQYLNFKFDITVNPNKQDIVVQLFLGRYSEDYLVLVNYTDPITVPGTHSISNTISGYSSNSNLSDAQLFSFVRGSLLNSTNLTTLLERNVESNYTRHLWGGDVALVVYVSNLTSPLTYKITVDQTDFLFILYFFATFILCFSTLLVAFMVGWFIKRKLEVRAYLRRQYIELQRRVSRPFARVKLVLDKKPPPAALDSATGEGRVQQNASYVAVETMKDHKASVLSLVVRLPGDRVTGRPAPGDTAFCFGSTLVKVSASKRSSKDRETSSSNGNHRSSRAHKRKSNSSSPHRPVPS